MEENNPTILQDESQAANDLPTEDIVAEPIKQKKETQQGGHMRAYHSGGCAGGCGLYSV